MLKIIPRNKRHNYKLILREFYFINELNLYVLQK
jgi:hypothetical protein